MGNPRKTAFKILLKVEQDAAYSNIALNNELKDAQLDQRDASFTAALVYGVLERKLTLDHIISQYTKMRMKKIEPKVLILLRLGVLQIVFMDKIPDSAAVNESVKLAKQNKLFSSSGFINGVLRSLSRAEGKYTLPNKEKDKLSYYAVRYSCPKELVALWIESYGEEKTISILKSLQGRPPIAVRVNTLKTNPKELIEELKNENIQAESSPIVENALLLQGTGAIETLTAYQQGLFHVQDLSSQLCCKVLPVKKGQRVYDVCAAPGGKSFTLAQRMENQGEIYAFDLYPHKIELINKGANRLSISILNAQVQDAVQEAELEEADCVLCDVPCSGLGILRRKPEIRYKSEFNFNELPKLQYSILYNSAKKVKVGGVLVYSTCTLHKKENNDNADKFLLENKEFEPFPIDLGDTIKKEIEEPENQFTLFPKENGTDGFFISAFKRIH